MDGAEETLSDVETRSQEGEHEEATFERWLDGHIGNDSELHTLWSALREVLVAELKDGAQISASAAFALCLNTLKTLQAEHGKLKDESNKSKQAASKNSGGFKKKGEAHDIQPDEVREAMRDHSEQLSAASVARIAAASRLLHYTSLKVPNSTAWSTLSISAPVLASLLKDSTPHTISVPALTTVSILLSHAPPALGATTSHLSDLFQLVLKLCISGKPKVRKRAIRTAHVLLEHFKPKPSSTASTSVSSSSSSTAPSPTYDVLCKSINTIVTAGFQHVSVQHTSVALYTLELIKHAINEVPVTMQKSWCTHCLSLPSLCSPLLTQCAFLTFESFFRFINRSSRSDASGPHQESNSKTETEAKPTTPQTLDKARQKLVVLLVNSLFEAQPAALDVGPTEAFCTAIAQGMLSLCKLDDANNALVKQLPKLFSSLVPIFKAGNAKSTQGASECLRQVLANGLSDSFLDMDLERVELDSGSEESAKQTTLYTIAGQLVTGLQLAYHDSWNEILSLAATFLERLSFSTITLGRLVNRLDAQQRQTAAHAVTKKLLERIVMLRVEDQPLRKRLDPVLKHALHAIGLPNFLTHIPIAFPNPLTGDMEGQNLWLLSFFRENINHAELSFFYNEMVPSAKLLQALSSQLSKSGRDLGAKHMMTLHDQIWGIFPRFCHNPRDLVDAFPMIAETLGMTIDSTPSVRVDIVHGLSALINRTSSAISAAQTAEFEFEKQHPELEAQSSSMNQGNTEGLEEHLQLLKDRHSELTRDLDSIRPFCQNFLPLLFNKYVTAGNPDEKNALFGCIEAFLTVSDAELINEFYTTILSTLLTTTPESGAIGEEMEEKLRLLQSLTSLSVAFVPYLSLSNLELLFKTVRPNLHRSSLHAKPVDYSLQKKSWKVVRTICEKNVEFARLHLADMQALLAIAEMVGTSKIYVVKAMCCLLEEEQLLAWMQGKDNSFASHFTSGSNKSSRAPKDSVMTPLPMIVMGWRETSAKTREAAGDALEAIGSSLGPERLIALLILGLSSSKDSFKAATISCITLVVQRFGKQLATIRNGQQFASLLKTSTVLLDYQGGSSGMAVDGSGSSNYGTGEIRGATIALIRACIKPAPLSILTQSLSGILKTILAWNDSVKTKFMRDIRFLIEKFLKRLDYDVVAEHMPKLHIKFLQNINQRLLHAKKMKKQNAKNGNKHTGDDSEDEFGDDAEEQGKNKMQVDSRGKQGKGKKSGNAATQDQAWLMEDGSEAPLDFTDPSANKSVVTVDPSKSKKHRSASSSPAFATGEDGRMIISDAPYKSSAGSKSGGGIVTDEVADGLEESMVASKKRKRSRDAEADDDSDQEATSSAMAVSGPEKKVWYDSKGFRDKPKRAKLDPTAAANTQTAAYRSSRAGGDAMRSGKMEPHAYVKPNPAFLNKRHRSQSVKQYEGLIGNKNKKRKN